MPQLTPLSHPMTPSLMSLATEVRCTSSRVAAAGPPRHPVRSGRPRSQGSSLSVPGCGGGTRRRDREEGELWPSAYGTRTPTAPSQPPVPLAVWPRPTPVRGDCDEFLQFPEPPRARRSTQPEGTQYQPTGFGRPGSLGERATSDRTPRLSMQEQLTWLVARPRTPSM